MIAIKKIGFLTGYSFKQAASLNSGRAALSSVPKKTTMGALGDMAKETAKSGISKMQSMFKPKTQILGAGAAGKMVNTGDIGSNLNERRNLTQSVME